MALSSPETFMNSAVGFVYQDDFASFLAGTKFVGDTSEDLSASAKFDSRSGEKNDHVFSYTSFVLYPLRARFTTK